jgi:hypothetical protein
VTTLQSRIAEDQTNRIDLSVPGSEFEVCSLVVKQADFMSWNLCAMGPAADEKSTTTLASTFLSLVFRTSAQAESFEKRLLLMKALQQGKVDERAAFRQSVCSRDPMSPLSSPTSNRSSVLSSVSLPGVYYGGRNQTPVSFESLPNIPSFGSMEGDFWMGVEAARAPNELGPGPIEERFEMPGG